MSYANATAARDKGVRAGDVISLKMAASETIYKGSIVTVDSSGYAVFATVGANLPYVGVALETKTSTTVALTSIKVATVGVFDFAASGTASQAWVGSECWLSSGSSGTPQEVVLADPGATALKVGRVVEFISATEVMVRINGYAFEVNCDAT